MESMSALASRSSPAAGPPAFPTAKARLTRTAGVGRNASSNPYILKGETRKGWFLEKNPAGQIPVLELADGTCISESTAILWYLADGTHLLPTEPLMRIRVLQWMCFEQTNVDGVIISRARFRRRFPDVIRTRPEEFEAWHGEWTRTLGVLDDHLRTRSFVVSSLPAESSERMLTTKSRLLSRFGSSLHWLHQVSIEPRRPWAYVVEPARNRP